MKPHTLITTTVPCHFGRDGQHRVTLGADADGKLVHISSDCDNLDPDVRNVADGLLGLEERVETVPEGWAWRGDEDPRPARRRKRRRVDCCARFVEEFVEAIGSAEEGNGARSIAFARDGIWNGMGELVYSFFRRVSLATEEARDTADRDRRNAKADLDLRPEFCKRLERCFRKRTGFTSMQVNVETTKDEHGNAVPVYPYRGLTLRLNGEIVALYLRRGVWSLNEESVVDLLNVTKTNGLHVETFRHDINYHSRDEKWTCPCCGSSTNRIEQHCKGNRHRRKFWDAITDGLEAMNARLVREKTGDQER